MPQEDKEETQHNTEEWEKDFLDFYFETGRYEKRKTGPQEYIKFIRQLLQSAREELIDEIVKMGDGMKKHDIHGDSYKEFEEEAGEMGHYELGEFDGNNNAITNYQKKIQSLKG